MAAGGHLGWPKITFDRISRHFRSIRNFIFFGFCSQNGRRRPFWMTENHFRSHFSPFQINKQLLFCLNLFHKMATGGHFGWSKITFDRICRHFKSIHNFFFLYFFSKWPPKTIGFFHYVLSMAMPNMKLIGECMTKLETPQAFRAFLCKMAARGHFVLPIDAKNHRVLVIWDLNGYGEYEFDWCICDKVMACTSGGVRRRRRRRNQKHNITKIFKFRGYNYSVSYVGDQTIFWLTFSTKYNIWIFVYRLHPPVGKHKIKYIVQYDVNSLYWTRYEQCIQLCKTELTLRVSV